MTDIAHLVQDLLAEAHRAAPDIAELMRQAAAALKGSSPEGLDTNERYARRMLDAAPGPVPIGPPDDDDEGIPAGGSYPSETND